MTAVDVTIARSPAVIDRGYSKPGIHELRQVVEHHEMGFFDDMVVGSIRWSLNQVLRHRDVHSFQLRYVKRGLGERSGRNFSEKLIVVGVILLEHSKRARCSDEVDASCCRVKLDL